MKEDPKPVIGMGVTEGVGSDDYPYEIVAVISPTRILVRRCDCTYIGGKYPSGLRYQLVDYQTRVCREDYFVVGSGEKNVGDIIDNNIMLRKGKYHWSKVGDPSSCYTLGHKVFYNDPSF